LCQYTIRANQIQRKKSTEKAEDLVHELRAAGIRAESDLRTIYNPGYKFNHWELKGVPIRLEIGPKDIENQCVILARRDTGSKDRVAWKDVVRVVALELEDMHKSLYNKAVKSQAGLVFKCKTWKEFLVALQKGGRAIAPWCGVVDCEMQVRERSGTESTATAAGLSGSAKSLCIPFDQPKEKPEVCFQCGNAAVNWTLFGRSY